MLRAIPDNPDLRDLRWFVIMTWSQLKIIADSFHEMHKYCVLFFKRCLLPDGLDYYEDIMDKTMILVYTRLYSTRSQDSTYSSLEEIKDDPFFQVMEAIPVELWIPTSCAPVWDIESSNKMRLAFEDGPPDHIVEEFKSLFKVFMKKYAPKRIFVPPTGVDYKVGTRKYNDGGVVKDDSERPEFSYSSAFLYQEFITRPNQKREVWLPGKAIKCNNSWITMFTQGISRCVKYSALDVEVMDIYESIKDKIRGGKIYFDISGYGFQYPREYLKVMVQVYNEFYIDDTLREHSEIFYKILENVNIQMPDGTFKYPQRGIGLGYYENLKTLGVWAIIDKFNPITAYGDQAILPFTRENLFFINELKKFRFIFLKEEKKRKLVRTVFKWAGSVIRPEGFHTPREVWTDLLGSFSKQYHWERKNAVKGITLPTEYEHIWKRFSSVYERVHGYEFYAGESLSHPDNMGVNPTAPVQEGYLKDWKVAMLPVPGLDFKNSILQSIPFTGTPKMGEAKTFQILRKKVWRKSIPSNTLFRNFVHPKIQMNKTHSPVMSRVARSVPMWADIRMFLFNGATTGKIVSGLSSEGVLAAPYRQRFARDVYHARATGGYEITTHHRGFYGADSDLELLSECVVAAQDNIDSTYCNRVDSHFEQDWTKPDEPLPYTPPMVRGTTNPYLAEFEKVLLSMREKPSPKEITFDEEYVDPDQLLEELPDVQFLINDEEDNDPNRGDEVTSLDESYLMEEAPEFLEDLYEDQEEEPEPVRVFGFKI